MSETKSEYYFQNLVLPVYEEYKKRYGNKTYKQIARILGEIQPKIEEEKRAKGLDVGQSLKPTVGNLLEQLTKYVFDDLLAEAVETLGLEISAMSKKALGVKYDRIFDQVKVMSEAGAVEPDVDLVIFKTQDLKVVAIISSKASARERIAQTGYWKLKFREMGSDIKVYYVTIDKDNDFQPKKRRTKEQAKLKYIINYDTNGAYVMKSIPEEGKIKEFDKLIPDLKKLLENGG